MIHVQTEGGLIDLAFNEGLAPAGQVHLNFTSLALQVLGTKARWTPGFPKPPDGFLGGWLGDSPSLPTRMGGPARASTAEGTRSQEALIEYGTRLWTLQFAPMTQNLEPLAARALREGFAWCLTAGKLHPTEGIRFELVADRAQNRLVFERLEFLSPDYDLLYSGRYPYLWN